MADNTKKIGAKIVIDGEAEFRQSINNSKAALKQFDAELKLTAEQFKGNEKSMEALQKVQQTYVKQQGELQKQQKSYEDQLEKANKAHKEASTIHEQTAKSVEELRNKLEKAKNVYGENSDEVKKLNTELADAEEQYSKEEKSIGKLETQMTRWETGLIETKTELAKVENNLESVNHDIEHFDDVVEDAGDSTSKANPNIEKLGVSMGQLVGAQLIAEGIRKMASALVELAKSSLDVGMNFEAAMSQVAGLSGAVGDDLDALTEKAREMGAKTMFSATDAADAFSYMALAGWDANQMLTGIEPVLNLAAAANMDLAKASDIVTDYLTAFGLEAKDAGKFTDQLAYAMANSNTDVEMLGEAYKNCAAAAGSMGYSVEDVTGALMTMANAGVKGGEAGTSLRAIMINLATNTNGAAEALADYGVQIYDEEGKMRNLSSILVETAGAFEGLSDQEANALAKQIAGKTQYTGFQTVMLGLSDAAKEAGMSMTDYADALQNCDGYAGQLADTMQDNLKGKLTILDSAFQALSESIYDVFDEDLKRGVGGATDALTRMNDAVKHGDLNVSLQKMSDALGELIDKAVDWAEDNLPKILDGLADMIDHADEIVPLIKGLAAGFIAFEGASAVISGISTVMGILSVVTGEATAAQVGLNEALFANPYVAVAALLAGVVSATLAWCDANEDTLMNMSDLDKATRDLTDDSSRLLDALDNQKQGREDNRQAMADEADYANSLVDKLERLHAEYSFGADNMTEMKAVIDELNSIYPELNLQINEQSGALNMTNGELEKNVELLQKQAMVEAAREDLTAIAKNKYEATKQLTELEKQRAEQLAEVTEKEEALNKATKDSVEAFETNGWSLDAAKTAYISAEEGLAALDEEIKATQESIEGFDEEYQQAIYFISENQQHIVETADNIKEVGEEAKQTAGEVAVLSDEFQTFIADMQEGIASTLESSNSIFEKTEEVEKHSIEEMQKNVQDHIDKINTWSDSYTELADRVDDSTGQALEYIANMGVEGQGYIDELLKLSDSDLNDFIQNMEEALSLPVEVSKKVTDSYTKAVQESIDGMRKIAEDEAKDGSGTKKAAEAVAEVLPDALEEGLGQDGENVTEPVDEALSTTETIIVESAEEIKTASEELARSITDPITNNVTHEKFYSIGENVGKGLEDGINSKLEDVRRAADEISRIVEEASKKRLEINSPSRVFKRIGAFVGEGLEIGIEDSMDDVVRTLNNTLPNEKNVEVSNFATMSTNFENVAGNNTLAQIDRLLTQYLPSMADKQIILDTGETVGALAQPMNRALGRIAQRGM